MRSDPSNKEFRDAELRRQAEKLRQIGKLKCAECKKTVSRNELVPFQDCTHNCIAIRLIEQADQMERDLDASCWRAPNLD